MKKYPSDGKGPIKEILQLNVDSLLVPYML